MQEGIKLSLFFLLSTESETFKLKSQKGAWIHFYWIHISVKNPATPCLTCSVKHRTGYSTPGMGSVKRKNHLLLPAGNTLPNIAWVTISFFCVCLCVCMCVCVWQGNISNSFSTWSPSGPPFLSSCFPDSQPLACAGAQGCCSLSAGLCTSRCWSAWGSYQLICPACWDLPGWQNTNLVNQSPRLRSTGMPHHPDT